jgi:hypothetical protein
LPKLAIVSSFRSSIWLLPGLLAAALPAAPAPAQTPAAQTPQDIVIVGQRLKDALRQFVDSTTQSGPTDQIARWDRQICPKVIGIDPPQAEFMTHRITEIAKIVGVRTGRSTCPTMLAIVFTVDATALADTIAADFPSDNWKVRALLKQFVDSARPVRWISLSDECGGERTDSGCPLPNSRLVKATSPILHAMLIIVDARKIHGFSIGEMSDYLAVVALGNPPLATDPPANSILSLFSRPTPNGLDNRMTDYDVSFLVGLYGIRLNLDAASQRTSIVSRMTRDLRKKSQSDQPQTPTRN